MAQQTQVPKFGNWESEEDVPYTQYFDNARKNKKGGKMDPNDPQDYLNAEMKSEREPEAIMPKHVRYDSRENGEMIRSSDPDAMSQKSASGSPHQRQSGSKYGSNRSDLDAPRSTDIQKSRHERQQSREEGDLRRSTDSPLRNEPTNRRTPHDSPHHRSTGMSAGDTPKRVGRQNAGSDRSIEHSPLHPHSQVRIGGRGSGVSSPSWERRVPLEGSQSMTPLTPGRSRLRSVTRGDETQPDHSPVVPKFGDWDENDPASAEGFSHIFNRVREEKQSGADKVPSMPNETSSSNGPKKIGTETSKGCLCFPWGRR